MKREFMNKTKNNFFTLDSILNSGHIFTDSEYLLKIHYRTSVILLSVLVIALILLGYTHYLSGNIFYWKMNSIASLVSILVIFTLRLIPKQYFYKLAHFSYIIFTILILYTFKTDSENFPMTVWFLIHIMGIFFIFNHTIVLRYIISFFIIFILIILTIHLDNPYLYIGDFLFTATLGYIFIYFYEYRTDELHKRLLAANDTLEERVNKEIKARIQIINQEKETLDFLAKHDYLSKVPNMFSLHQSLDLKCQNHDNAFALVYIDLNKFKYINDTHGHSVGNNVIEIIANRLQNIITKNDMVARVGGDEFILLIDNYQTQETFKEKLTLYIKEIEKEINMRDTILTVTASIGVSIFPEDHTDKEYLIKFADRAMKKSKQSSMSCYTFYANESLILGYSKIKLESDIYYALKKEEFILHYQPQVDIKTQKIVGAEALLRWDHPILGILTPKYFIELAKEIGILPEIEKFVLNTAFNTVSKWHYNHQYKGRISINLSIQKWESKHFLKEVAQALVENKCKGEWIEFEILETDIVSDTTKMQNILEKLHKQHIHVAIDDFGTGYASLSYLLLLDIDRIKIDKIFIDNLFHSSRNISIIDAITTIAHNFNHDIIVEGVETQKQLDLLTKHNCKVIQGYYFHKPLDYVKFCTLL